MGSLCALARRWEGGARPTTLEARGQRAGRAYALTTPQRALTRFAANRLAAGLRDEWKQRRCRNVAPVGWHTRTALQVAGLGGGKRDGSVSEWFWYPHVLLDHALLRGRAGGREAVQAA